MNRQQAINRLALSKALTSQKETITNANTVDGKSIEYILSRENHTGKIPAHIILGLSKIAVSGSYNDLSDKPVVPRSTNDLVNNSGFLTPDTLNDYLSSKQPTININGIKQDLSKDREWTIHFNLDDVLSKGNTTDKSIIAKSVSNSTKTASLNEDGSIEAIKYIIGKTTLISSQAEVINKLPAKSGTFIISINTVFANEQGEIKLSLSDLVNGKSDEYLAGNGINKKFPTNLSHFNNDSGYLNKDEIQALFVSKHTTINGKSINESIILSKEDFEDLKNVENTKDIDKPVSTLQKALIETKLGSDNIIVGEVLQGIKNGANKLFVFNRKPLEYKEAIYINGLRQNRKDYNLQSDVLILNTPLQPTDTIIADYIY